MLVNKLLLPQTLSHLTYLCTVLIKFNFEISSDMFASSSLKDICLSRVTLCKGCDPFNCVYYDAMSILKFYFCPSNLIFPMYLVCF